MREVPYHGNPGNACALACYTMAAQYLLPNENITFEQLGKIADWRPGYVVWAFPVWKWLMDRGLKITDYDVIDYDAWVKDGISGLKSTVSEKEFQFYEENTYDLEQTGKQAKAAFDHPNFTYFQKNLTWHDVLDNFNKPGICDISIDGRLLNDKPGFSLHRVLLVDITDEAVTFHDPNFENNGDYRKLPIQTFRSNFESLDSPELARYRIT